MDFGDSDIGDILEDVRGHKFVFGGISESGRYILEPCKDDEESYWYSGEYDKNRFYSSIKTNLTLETNIKNFRDEFDKLLKKYNLRVTVVVDEYNDAVSMIVDKHYNTFYEKVTD